MVEGGRGAYLKNEILETDGWRLVQLIYQAAIEAIGKAREHLREGAIQARSRQITRASELVAELALSLDHNAGGSLSRNLAELYDYMQRLLQEANFRQIEPPLVEAQDLLRTLLEAWQEAAPAALACSTNLAPYSREAERVPVDCLG
jgi:flagellar protein FliS